MFYLNVSNVDIGVAHVAMTIYACFKYFIYFRHMLQMLYLDVLKVDLVLHMLLWLYMHVSSAYFKCFIYLIRMLQLFHLDVLKIDLREAHLLLLVRRHRSLCHHGSPCASASADAAACM
jgi:hypothetical protein